MAFNRPSLEAIKTETWDNYLSLFNPIEGTPRYNILKVLSLLDAGQQHQMFGDIDFLSKQIFPDTATGDYLRAHWSIRVAPLYAVQAVGLLIITGVPGASIPAGLVYSSPTGIKYFSENASVIGSDGDALVYFKSSTAGSVGNLAEGTQLSVASALPSGIDSIATVAEGGIVGGVDGESDEEYLVRVLQKLRETNRYGKVGDFALWAIDSSAEVSKAFEIKNFSVFGALLIQVVGGDQISGIVPVGNIEQVKEYIEQVAPPVLFEIRTPYLVELALTIGLLPAEDTVSNRELIESRIKTFLDQRARPGIEFTNAQFKNIIVDGIIITDASVTGGDIETTVLEYPVLGEITWIQL